MQLLLTWYFRLLILNLYMNFFFVFFIIFSPLLKLTKTLIHLKSSETSPDGCLHGILTLLELPHQTVWTTGFFACNQRWFDFIFSYCNVSLLLSIKIYNNIFYYCRFIIYKLKKIKKPKLLNL